MVDDDLVAERLGTAEDGGFSLESRKGSRGVPGGVRSLKRSNLYQQVINIQLQNYVQEESDLRV